MRFSHFVVAVTSVVVIALPNSVAGQDECRVATLIPPEGDYYSLGHAVLISGDLALVAAPEETVAPCQWSSGVVYEFRVGPEGWALTAGITAAVPDGYDRFGWSLAITEDRLGLMVGARGGEGSGSVHIFSRDETTWIEIDELTPSDGAYGDRFGRAVAVSGEYLVVGAPYDDDLGETTGSAYVFHYDGKSWSEQAKLNASDGASVQRFGRAVAITGDYIFVGTGGRVYLFKREGQDWLEQARLHPDGPSGGFGVSISASGDSVIIAAAHGGDDPVGAAYVFTRQGTDWISEARLVPTAPPADAGSIRAVAISGDYSVLGVCLAIGSDLEMCIPYVFIRSGGTWDQIGELSPGFIKEYDLPSQAVSIDGQHVLAGNVDELDSSGWRVGASFLYALAGGEDCNTNLFNDACERDCDDSGIPEDCGPLTDCNDNGEQDGCDIYFEVSIDCNGNGVPDECDPLVDCNGNGILDACDIVSAFSLDCNENGIPDECDPLVDCNANGELDACDIVFGVSSDCNGNGIPDECDPLVDCNGNGQLDACDVAFETSTDCNENGIPDECDPLIDCNGNGIQDACDVLPQEWSDCNDNGIPDECDLASGSSSDCNRDQTPDDCQPNGDCNANGVSDLCDIWLGVSRDCHGNLIPDECELADGTSVDVDANGVPDDCECAEAMFALVPVGASGSHTISTENNQIFVSAGQEVELEIYGCGWDDGGEWTSALKTWEATIDSRGFTSGLTGYLEPYAPPCEDSGDCRYEPDGAYCYGLQCTAAFQDCPRPASDMCLDLPACDNSGADLRCGSTAIDPVTFDTGELAYGATVVLSISPDASGTFTVPFLTGPPSYATWIRAWCTYPTLRAVRPALITIQGGCCLPDGSCSSHGPESCLALGGTARNLGCQGDCDGDGADDLCSEYPDCNSNALPDACDIDNGVSEDCTENGIPDECEPDCNGNGVADSCDTLDGTSEDCNGNEIPDECDFDADCNSNGIPDECECLPSVAAGPEAPVVYRKNRYLSFIPDSSNPGCSRTALRITLTDPPAGFEEHAGLVRWVGEPHPITEISSLGDPDATPPTFTGAELQRDPHCMDWNEAGLVDAFGTAVLPNATYEIQAVACACDLGAEENYSAPLPILTGLWGDLVGDCSVAPCTGPDGVVDFVDIAALVDKFRNAPSALGKARVDIAENRPDTRIDFIDISWAVAAFRGWGYPFEGPLPCE